MNAAAGLLLLAAPDSDEARGLAEALRAGGAAVEVVHDTPQALRVLAEARVDGLITALEAKRLDGRALLERARALQPDLCAIVLVAAGEEAGGLDAMARGAADYEVWPGSADKLRAVLERGRAQQALARHAAALGARLAERHNFEPFAGHGAEMVRLLEQARRLATAMTPVRLLGEPGTGKDLLAQAMHQNSPRAARRFVRGTVDALERGLEDAAGGTLLIDGRDGATDPVLARRLAPALAASVDVFLLVAARPGSAGADGGLELPGFTTLRLPPLRERPDDVPLLIDRFLREMNREYGRRVTGVTRGALAHLRAHAWPGNVRELKSTIEGMVVFAEGRRPLDVSDLPLSLRQRPDHALGGGTVTLAVDMSLAEAEKRFMEETLRAVGYDRPRAAATLGIGLRTLYRKLKEYEIG